MCSCARCGASSELWYSVTSCSRPCMQIAPVATVALGELAKKLLEVCKNPMQPHFNHFLFESVAALIHFGESGSALQH